MELHHFLFFRAVRQTVAQTIAGWIFLTMVLVAGIILTLFFSGHVVVLGVPSSVIVRFLQDDIARTAYIDSDRKLLHDRLDEIGIEEQMKRYYRPQIPDETQLDQHIHQILYDRTGYVGEAYRVDATDTLVLKNN